MQMSRIPRGIHVTHARSDDLKGGAMPAKSRTLWTFAITAVAVFMATLDNLVVTTALPVIRKDLHASIQGLDACRDRKSTRLNSSHT